MHMLKKWNLTCRIDAAIIGYQSTQNLCKQFSIYISLPTKIFKLKKRSTLSIIYVALMFQGKGPERFMFVLICLTKFWRLISYERGILEAS